MFVPHSLVGAKEWESAQPRKIPTIPQGPSNRQIENTAPRESFCFTDASWDPRTRSAGLAWIFTDQSSQELDRGSKAQTHVSSPCMGEALAIREGLLHAASHNFTHIWTDSQVLATAINSGRKTTEFYGVLADIDDLSFSPFSPFSSCLFVYIPRNTNGPADGLAKTCLSTHLALSQNFVT